MSISKANSEGYSVGSGAYSVASPDVAMVLDELGNYEAVYSSLEALEQASMVCSMSNSVDDESTVSAALYSGISNVRNHPVVGYYVGLYAGHVVEGDYRACGSSGGVTTWLLVELLNKGMIDGVVHVIPSSHEEKLFDYSVSRTEKEIREGAKSRYYPAEFSGPIKEIIASEGRFAVVGIPSFIMELRLLQKYVPELRDKIAYTVGLICGHQKSAKYAECIAWQFGIKPGDLKSIDFRKKVDGAPANEYITEIVGSMGGKDVTLVKRQEDIFVSNWGHGFFKRKFSDFTDDAFNETADIALGDAWLPEYMKDADGNNVVIVRNPELKSIIEMAITERRLSLDRVRPELIVGSQAGLVRHAKDEISYRLSKRLKNKQWHPTKRVDPNSDLSFFRKRIQDTRQQISELSHIRYQEAVARGDFDYFVKKMRFYVIKYRALYILSELFEKGPLWAFKKAFSRFVKRWKM